MSVYRMVRGDTTPAVKAPLSDENGIAPLDGATVLFKMSMVDEAGDDVPAPLVGVAEVTDLATGFVAYEWQDGDTDVAGVYHQEWEVTFAGGGVETFPSEPNTIIIRADL